MSGHPSSLARRPALLPPEILLAICEQLHWQRDKETLRSCSLVCHAWLPISHSQLFRTIYYKPPPKGYSDCFVRFFSFFFTSQYSGSNLGRHVEDLTFTGERRQVSYSPYGIDKYYDPEESEYEDDDPESVFVDCPLDVLMDLSSVFTRLKRLTLVKLTIVDEFADHRRRRTALGDDGSSGGQDDDDHGTGANDGRVRDGDTNGVNDMSGVDDPIDVLPEDCSALGELRINEVYSAFNTYRDIFQVICSFTEIGKLSLDFMPWSESKRRHSNPASWFAHVTPTHCPVIRKIDLVDPVPFLVRMFHDFLRRSGALEGSLQSFKFRGGMDGMKEIIAFKPLLVDFSTHLRELNLDLWERIFRRPNALNHWREIPLSRCTALESLILPIGRAPQLTSVSANGYASRAADIVKIYTGWLSDRDSLPALRAVTFEVLLDVDEPTYLFEGSREKHQSAWHDMATHLARRPLERVSIVLLSYKEELDAELRQVVKDFFATPMAPLQSKAILNFQFIRQPTFQELFY